METSDTVPHHLAKVKYWKKKNHELLYLAKMQQQGPIERTKRTERTEKLNGIYETIVGYEGKKDRGSQKKGNKCGKYHPSFLPG